MQGKAPKARPEETTKAGQTGRGTTRQTGEPCRTPNRSGMLLRIGRFKSRLLEEEAAHKVGISLRDIYRYEQYGIDLDTPITVIEDLCVTYGIDKYEVLEAAWHGRD